MKNILIAGATFGVSFVTTYILASRIWNKAYAQGLDVGRAQGEVDTLQELVALHLVTEQMKEAEQEGTPVREVNQLPRQ